MYGHRTDILLVVEHSARELDIACALKYLLQVRNHLSVQLADSFQHTLALRRSVPSIVAYPFFYTSADPAIQQTLSLWRDAIYVNLTYEQIDNRFTRAIRAPKDAFVQKCVFHHVWSDSYADYLQENGVPRNHIFVNGNPSYTLYQLPYSRYFATRDEIARKHGLDLRKRWLFLPDSYGVAFNTDARWQSYIERGRSEAEVQEYRAFAQSSFREVVSWYHKAAQMPDVEVIVRPRPATPQSVFIKACVEALGGIRPKFRIIKEGSVREWVLTSDMVLSPYSTTLIEAAIAGKPIYMVAPRPFPEFVRSAWHDRVTKVDALSALLDAVAQPELPDNWRPLCHWAKDTMLSRGDAIANLADWLAQLCRQDATCESSSSLTGSHSPAQIGWVDIMSETLKREGQPLAQQWRRLAGKAALDVHEQDVIRSRDIEMRLSKWAEVLSVIDV